MSTTLAFYILAAVLGAILSWLLTGGKKKQLRLLEENARKERSAMNDLLTEFTLFKSDAKSQLQLKDKEIAKQKKSSAFPDIIANAQEKEITHWKNKAKELESRIKKGSSNNGSASSSVEKELKRIKQQLTSLEKDLKAKDLIIEELEASLDSDSKANIGQDSSKKTIKKLKKKLKACKKKLKAKPKKEIETVEIKETLNIPKLRKLLKQGKLTKTSKKVLKKKTSRAKSKKTDFEKPTPSFSKGKSILDLIPELKSDS